MILKDCGHHYQQARNIEPYNRVRSNKAEPVRLTGALVIVDISRGSFIKCL